MQDRKFPGGIQRTRSGYWEGTVIRGGLQFKGPVKEVDGCLELGGTEAEAKAWRDQFELDPGPLKVRSGLTVASILWQWPD